MERAEFSADQAPKIVPTFATIPQQFGPSFDLYSKDIPAQQQQVERAEFSTPSAPKVIPSQASVSQQFGPSFDIYSKDVYSQQNFAQLEPFFRPSEQEMSKVFSIEEAPTFPGIIRHITTYGRSLDLSPKPSLVDYGAATGQDGAFGWYSDHPVTHK